jgi:CubicO group peptidase (beta-lactamase class C family)
LEAGLALSCWLHVACGSSDAAPARAGGAPEGGAPDGGGALDFSAFEAELAAFVADTGLPGAGAIVIHRDQGVVYRGAVGEYDVDRAYLVASASKIVSVGMMMKLVDDGLVDIERPISEYVSWAGSNGGLNLRQLFSNSSGLPGLLSGPDDTFYLTNYVCQFTPTGTLRDCAENVLTTDVGAEAIPPDTEFRYGGAQWQAAGGVVEAIAGKPWGQLFTETFAEPCGLESSGYTHPTWPPDGSYPQDLQGNAANAPVSDNPSIEAGLYTNLDDYAKILSIHLRGGLCGFDEAAPRVLSEESVAAMRVDRVAAYGGTASIALPGSESLLPLEGYGLGWWVDRANPGVFVDEGAWGATPWIDLGRGYAAFITIESTFLNGDTARRRTQPLLEAIFDG